MSHIFHGYAAVFNVLDSSGEQYLPGCFAQWLQSGGAHNLPLLDGHDSSKVLGTCLHFHEDGFGLFVVARADTVHVPIGAGLSGLIGTPADQVGGVISYAVLTELSVVSNPTNPLARVMGPPFFDSENALRGYLSMQPPQ